MRVPLWLIAAWLCGSVTLPSAPPKPNAVNELEVEFRSGAHRLVGTLSFPGGEDPRPGVVILGGAERGPRDAMKRKMARLFAENGVVSLTYDSPGTGGSAGSALSMTKADRVAEALAAHRFLVARPDTDPRRVGIWGISEGADVALLAASRRAEVAFIIAVSGGLGISPLEISRHRIEMAGLDRGMSFADLEKARVLGELLWTLLAGEDLVEWPLLEMKARRWPDEHWKELIDLLRRRPEDLATRILPLLETWKGQPWFEIAFVNSKNFERLAGMPPEHFRALLASNPLARGDWEHQCAELREFQRLACPVLAIWGEDDRFLPARRSLATFRRSVSASELANLTLEILPETTHIMTRRGSTELNPAYTRRLFEWLCP